jgi:hypothetical protein
MLFRVLSRLMHTKYYFDEYMVLLSEKISPFTTDYSRFLELIFNLLIVKPCIEVIKFISCCLKLFFFILSTLIQAIKIVFRFTFIKLPTIMILFYVLFDFALTYLFIEFVFMFVSTYIFSFKVVIKSHFIEYKEAFYYDIVGYPGLYGSFAMEIYPDEYQDYLDSFEKIPAPDLNVYYPMRFALSSVMIRLTGVLLSISFVFILFFNFTNLFIIVDSNFSELRRTFAYKIIELFQHYREYYTKHFIKSKYFDDSFFSLIKMFSRIIYTNIKICFNYLLISAYLRFEIIESLFMIKYFFLHFFYNFFSYLFIFIFPIHFYYVLYHSYKIISISKYVFLLIYFFYKFIKFLGKIVLIILTKIWNIFYLIATAEEPDVHKTTNNNDVKINNETSPNNNEPTKSN